jgi:hypothetical protein
MGHYSYSKRSRTSKKRFLVTNTVVVREKRGYRTDMSTHPIILQLERVLEERNTLETANAELRDEVERLQRLHPAGWIPISTPPTEADGVKQNWDEGKKIQSRTPGSFRAPDGSQWEDDPNPDWNPLKEYQIKPWALPPPPEGQSWHRADWTEEMLPEGWRPLLLNEPFQVNVDQWTDDPKNGVWYISTYPINSRNSLSDCFCRTLRPLPAPKPVQWRLLDVGEAKAEGDESLNGHTWIRCVQIGHPVADVEIVRRKINP